jgi:hypothetical protein
MNRKEIKARVGQLLSEGTTETEVFNRLAGQGVKDRTLAYWIAARPDPQRCHANRGHLLAVRIIAWVQAILAALAGFGAGIHISTVAALIFAAMGMAFGLMFVWAFSKNNVAAYNIYLLLSITQLPRQFSGPGQATAATWIIFLIGVVLFAYIWYVRTRIFPDFNFLSPKKIGGKYVFSR